MSALCKIERCIGCSSCASICQRNAISMVPDDSGFLFPKIEKALCVDCKLCERVCPVLHQPAVSVHTEMRKEKCSKLQNWIVSCGARWKQNGWIEAGLFIFLLYAIHFCVYLNGDDFMYATFGKQGILENVWNYYHTGNGRFWINILDSALLVFDRYLFIFLNPLLILAFLYLLAKNVQTILGEKIELKCLVFTGGCYCPLLMYFVCVKLYFGLPE